MSVWGKGGPIRRIRGKGRGMEEEIAAEPNELGPRTGGVSRRRVHYEVCTAKLPIGE